jgi:FKBP-type peptidyl-prolyl cis-trans isomerase 2
MANHCGTPHQLDGPAMEVHQKTSALGVQRMPRAQEGDQVTVVYQGILEDGSIFDCSEEDDPLTFVLGEDTVLPGFENAIIGMEIGEQKTVRVPPEDGFGLHLQRLVDSLSVEALPAGVDVSVGSQLDVTTEDGSRFEVTVTNIESGLITLDANHPLAGQALIFHIELLAIDRPTIN